MIVFTVDGTALVGRSASTGRGRPATRHGGSRPSASGGVAGPRSRGRNSAARRRASAGRRPPDRGRRGPRPPAGRTAPRTPGPARRCRAGRPGRPGWRAARRRRRRRPPRPRRTGPRPRSSSARQRPEPVVHAGPPRCRSGNQMLWSSKTKRIESGGSWPCVIRRVMAATSPCPAVSTSRSVPRASMTMSPLPRGASRPLASRIACSTAPLVGSAGRTSSVSRPPSAGEERTSAAGSVRAWTLWPSDSSSRAAGSCSGVNDAAGVSCTPGRKSGPRAPGFAGSRAALITAVDLGEVVERRAPGRGRRDLRRPRRRTSSGTGDGVGSSCRGATRREPAEHAAERRAADARTS